MKDIFDECRFKDLTLKSRIVRTGLWESQKEMGNLSPEIFLRYERLAKNHVGLIVTELISMYDHDRFSDYSHSINNPKFIKEFKYLTGITMTMTYLFLPSWVLSTATSTESRTLMLTI